MSAWMNFNSAPVPLQTSVHWIISLLCSSYNLWYLALWLVLSSIVALQYNWLSFCDSYTYPRTSVRFVNFKHPQLDLSMSVLLLQSLFLVSFIKCCVVCTTQIWFSVSSQIRSHIILYNVHTRNLWRLIKSHYTLTVCECTY